MDKIEIIQRIGIIRVRAKLTQKALSATINMNQSYINRLESKKDFLPSLEVLLKIIEACGSTPEEFFYRDIPSYESDKQLLEKLKNLSVKQIDTLLKYDAELMSAFETINKRGVSLFSEDLERLNKKS